MTPARAHLRVLSGLSVNFVLFGASMTLFAAAIPGIIREYSWSYTEAGIVLSASAVGYLASTLVCGLLMQRWGAKPILLVTLVLEGLSFLLFARTPSVAVNTLLNFAIGLGQGGTEVVSNYTVIRIERDGRSRLMNLMHATFCVGGILGPIGVAGLLQSNLGWRMVFPGMGVLLLAISLWFAVTRFDVAAAARGGATPLPAGAGRSREVSPLLILYAAVILLYVGVELSLSNWSPEFFVRYLGASGREAAAVVAVLWTGLLAGRLGISWLYRGSRQEVPLLFLALGTSLFLAVLLAVRSLGSGYVAVAFLGLSLSGTYPLVMSLVGRRFGSPAAIGFVSTAGGVGSFSFPFALAWIADRWGLRRGFVFCFAVALLMVAGASIVAAVARRSPSRVRDGV